MDLVYMTEVLVYQSIRGPVHDKYSYNLDINNEQTKTSKSQKTIANKTPCKICQEQKKRSLRTYIRSKSHEHSEELKEEEEEEEPQGKPMQEKKEAKKR